MYRLWYMSWWVSCWSNLWRWNLQNRRRTLYRLRIMCWSMSNWRYITWITRRMDFNDLLDSSRFFFAFFRFFYRKLLFLLYYFLSLSVQKYNQLIYNIFNRGFIASQHQGIGADGGKSVSVPGRKGDVIAQFYPQRFFADQRWNDRWLWFYGGVGH